MRASKTIWVLLLTLGLIGFMGGTSVVMADQTDPPHQTHLDHLRGPGMGGGGSPCVNCHTGGSPGQGDVDSDVCDTCHSAGGAYDGVDDPDVGAKNNWQNIGDPEGAGATESMIYENGTLKSGKEKWCATCHDEDEYSLEEGVLIDHFETYTDDVTLRDNWKKAQDVQQRFLEPLSTDITGPDGSQCMRVKLNWTNNTTYAYGSVYRDYAPSVDLTDMDAVNLYVKVSDPLKIDKIKVQLRNEGQTTFCAASVNGYQLHSGGDGWTKIRLPRASFNDTTWGLVDKIRIRILEDDPNGSHIEYVYFDNIYFSKGGPNVIGDNQTYGYYITGHNLRNCTWCHDPNSEHIDGESLPILEYVKNTPNPTNFRFYDDPAKQLRLPYNYYNTTDYNNQDFALCYWCHSENNLIGDVWGGGTNFKDRNQGTCGMPKNYHYVHVWMFADDMWPQTCVSCHDPHGQLNPAMTRKEMGDALAFDTNGCEITDQDDRHDPAINKGLALQSNLIVLADGPNFINSNSCASCHSASNVYPPNEPPCNSGDNPYTPARCLGDGSYLRTYEILPHTGGMDVGPGCFTAGCHTASQNHATHFVNVNGPRIPPDENGCYYCHADARLQCADGVLFRNLENPEGPPLSLADTTVCDSCHN